jgi:hypothetical protein
MCAYGQTRHTCNQIYTYLNYCVFVLYTIQLLQTSEEYTRATSDAPTTGSANYQNWIGIICNNLINIEHHL